METENEIVMFFNAIREDNRISRSHISLYMAIFYFYNMQGSQNPIRITRTIVMELAKMNSVATYHRCMKDLNEFGYVKYEPSYNPAIKSMISLVKI